MTIEKLIGGIQDSTESGEKSGERECVDSEGFSEEVEEQSLRPVEKEGKWRPRRSGNMEIMHSQVLRIRAEDSHLGEDIGLSSKGKSVVNVNVSYGQNLQLQRFAASAMDVVFSSRPILPCSPLSGKSVVKASH